MESKTNNMGQAQGLDLHIGVEQCIHNLPHDCRWRTTSGFSFSTPTAAGEKYIHAPCNMLTCRSCAKRFYHQVHPALLHAFHDPGLRFHVSLTLPGNIPLEEQESILKDSLRRLLQHAKRTFDNPLHYAWVIGTHRNGHPHVHMLVNRDLRRASRRGRRIPWLKSVWFSMTHGHQVKAVEIKPGTEANVVQYILQNLFETVLRGQVTGRKYGCSRSIKLRPARRHPDPGKWTRNKHPTAYYARLAGQTDLFMNREVIVLNDTAVSSAPGRGEAPLERRGAVGGPTVPAGAGAGAGAPVPPLTPEVPPQ